VSATTDLPADVRQVLRLTSAERQEALKLLAAARAEPVVVASPYRRRPRPSKQFRKLTPEERDQLLAREAEECGPGTLALRIRAVAEARKIGDPRALAGSLEDVAAAALSWSQRTVVDMVETPVVAKKTRVKI
jgi:hypothetical protein